ncbi:uncharacterized protein A1O9_08025 [Exophiala aquamarina CBS 119918]|uniref:BTB domain-containing protein n=1 Tax=Exophiala aquamarina CBS 119918 TaxID=1182545 RepID=A0A072P8L6_9EURO|nr:uncharacterized protein A1O9_08025 [Exophiala aquamarina CBS 119918]KEF56444.1 hypothetical protein A1O9_08025 [Exophiala aquamarina CBS 119918]
MSNPSLGLEILKTGEFSDFTIECQGTQFRVHRNVICRGSPVLYKMCAGSFKEASEQKATYNEVIPSVMGRVILFLYTKTYDASNVPEIFRSLCSDPPELEFRQIENEGPTEEEGELEASERMAEDEPTIVADPQEGSDTAPKAISSNAPQDSESDDQVSEEDKQDKIEKIAKCLKVNAMVYKYADYLGIKELAELASDRFLEDAKEVHLLDNFADPLVTLYEQVPPSDQGLRLRITTFMTENYEEVCKKPMTDRVMDYYTDGYWKVCVKLMDRQKELHKTALDNELVRLIDTLDLNQMRCKHKSKVVFRLPTSEESIAEQKRWVFDFTCRLCQMRYPS